MVVNIHPLERGLSIAAGAAAIRLSKHFRLKPRLSLLTIGGALAARGLTGHSIIYTMLQGSTQRRTRLKDLSAVVQGPVRVRSVATINKPIDEVDRALRDKDILTQVLDSLPTVHAINFGQEDFSVAFAHGVTLTFATKTDIIAPYNYLIHGKERESLTFELKVKLDAGAGTRTKMQIDFGAKPPLGKVGELASQPLTPLLNKVLSDFIHKFKMRVETGEISSIAGQSTGAQLPESASRQIEAPIEQDENRYATAGV